MAENYKSNSNERRDSNPDPITKAPGSHPVSTGIGAAAAGAAGAALGSVVPGIGTVIGGVVGAIAGGVGGGYAGKAVGEAIDPTGDDEYWREHHSASEYAKGVEYDTLKPAYKYGASLATREDNAVFDEKRARTDWEVGGEPGLPYEKVAPAIRDAYDKTLKLREEQLRVSKERVTTGEVSLRKEIVTEQKTVEVPVEREELVITRRNVAGTTADAGTIGDVEEIRIPVSEERVNVSKDTVVTGEVEIGKRKVTDKQVVSDTVRKEQLKVDSTGKTRVVDDRTSQD